MKISNPKDIRNKDLIVFDLDGTLSPSKSAMDNEMAELLSKLTHKKLVAVISGGELKQYKIQMLFPMKGKKAKLKNFYLFPTNSTAFYKWNRAALVKVYSYALTGTEVRQIRDAFAQAFKQINYKHPAKVYGQVIENRGTQVSFSALGQKVVAMLGKKGVALKEQWRDRNDIRPKLAKVVATKLPKFQVRVAGVTTIDVVRKGIDKAYGIRQIEKRLKIPVKKMLFVGDAIEPGKNDYEALKTGIDYVAVKGPEETKLLIKKLLE